MNEPAASTLEGTDDGWPPNHHSPPSLPPLPPPALPAPTPTSGGGLNGPTIAEGMDIDSLYVNAFYPYDDPQAQPQLQQTQRYVSYLEALDCPFLHSEHVSFFENAKSTNIFQAEEVLCNTENVQPEVRGIGSNYFTNTVLESGGFHCDTTCQGGSQGNQVAQMVTLLKNQQTQFNTQLSNWLGGNNLGANANTTPHAALINCQGSASSNQVYASNPPAHLANAVLKPPPESDSIEYFPLTILPDDNKWLTPLHCFVRQYCVEVFVATAADTEAPCMGKRSPVTIGQVGIRCPYCSPKNEQTGCKECANAVVFPSNVSRIYNATINLLQRHLKICSSVPPQVVLRYDELKAESARSGASKKYWVDSAFRLGLYDTPNGIRLNKEIYLQTKMNIKRSQENSVDVSRVSNDGSDTSPLLVVIPSDKCRTTEFTFHVMAQVQHCAFTEADRLGRRRNLEVGFLGLACRHCFGGSCSGRFFPSSIKTMSDGSKTLNVIYGHICSCKKCPIDIKQRLNRLRETHESEMNNLPLGSQRTFFTKIWKRLHGNEVITSKQKAVVPLKSLIDATPSSCWPSVITPERELDQVNISTEEINGTTSQDNNNSPDETINENVKISPSPSLCLLSVNHPKERMQSQLSTPLHDSANKADTSSATGFCPIETVLYLNHIASSNTPTDLNETVTKTQLSDATASPDLANKSELIPLHPAQTLTLPFPIGCDVWWDLKVIGTGEIFKHGKVVGVYFNYNSSKVLYEVLSPRPGGEVHQQLSPAIVGENALVYAPGCAVFYSPTGTFADKANLLHAEVLHCRTSHREYLDAIKNLSMEKWTSQAFPRFCYTVLLLSDAGPGNIQVIENVLPGQIKLRLALPQLV